MIDIKASKGKYGSVLILKYNNTEYKFRAPTCKEYIQYIHMLQVDKLAADSYLLVQCSLDNISYNNIPPAIINKALEYFIKLYNNINPDEYKKAKLNGTHNDLLQLIYLISLKYNVSPMFLLDAPINQIIDHIIILEQLTGIPFYNEDNTQEEIDDVKTSDINNAFRKAFEKLNKLKEENDIK